MASEQDDVLTVSDHSSDEFSGFSPVSDSGQVQKIKKNKSSGKIKGKPSLKIKRKENKENKGKAPVKPSGSNVVRPITSKFDISSLKDGDISKLRELLGITPPINTQANSGDLADDNDFQSYFGYKLDSLPRMSVEFDPDDLSDGDPPVGKKRHV